MPTVAPEIPSRRARLWLCLALSAATLAVYWPVTGFPFITCDDPDYVTDNSIVKYGVTWQGVVWAFQTFYAANWHPVTWLSHMLDVEFFGLRAGPHHFVNLLFHTANALLLFLLFHRMTGALRRSALVAALFALHPLHVESVAWVAERKDLLSTFFGLLAIWAYALYAVKSRVQPAATARQRGESPKSGVAEPAATQHAARTTHHAPSPSSILQPPASSLQPAALYALSLLFFALSLMSKPMLVTLPFLLLLLDYWPLTRFQLKTLLPLLVEKLPFLALSAASSVITILAQRGGGAMSSLESLPLTARAANAATAYLLYLVKTVWPHPLAIFYPHNRDWTVGPPVIAGLCLLTVSAAALLSMHRRPYFAVGWFWFLGTLVPVIGLVQVGGQAMADRYSYLPLVGIFVLSAWGISEFLSRWRGRIWILTALGSVAILACVTVTARHLPRWKSSETLCRHALQVTTNNHLAHTTLGADLANQGRHAEAKAQYDLALQIAPDYYSALAGMGKLLLGAGNEEEAAALFRRTLEVQPREAVAHHLLGSILAKKGKLDEAATHFKQAIRLDPNSPHAHVELAALLVTRGEADAALSHGLTALRLDPASSRAHFNVAGALFLKGRFSESVFHYRGALGAEPDFFEAHLNCAKALQNLGKLQEAETDLREALRLKPDHVEAHRLLAVVSSARQLPREQAREYAEMLRLQPDWPEVQNNLAWLLATHPDAQLRDGPRAVSLAERACQLTGSTNLWLLSTLAAAYAEAKRYTEAVTTQQKLCDMAAAQGRTNQLDMFQRRLERYRSGQPYHEP